MWNDLGFDAVRVLFVSSVDGSYAISLEASSHVSAWNNIIFCGDVAGALRAPVIALVQFAPGSR